MIQIPHGLLWLSTPRQLCMHILNFTSSASLHYALLSLFGFTDDPLMLGILYMSAQTLGGALAGGLLLGVWGHERATRSVSLLPFPIMQ
jgi:hypothetical protein